MRYIHSDEIINDLKNRMSRYFASSKVDESVLPRVIASCLGEMGAKIFPVKRTMVDVLKCKGELPADFRKVLMAVTCNHRVEWHPTSVAKHTEDRIVCSLGPCETMCDVYLDDCGNMHKIVQTIDLKKYEYQDFEILKPTTGCKAYCDGNSINLKSRSSDEFEIRHNGRRWEMVTSFDEGTVYIEYQGELIQEDGFMIPDNEIIKGWIFEEMRKEVYTYLWDSGEEVQGKMQHAEGLAHIKKEQARQLWNRSGISSYYNLANKLQARYKAQENWIHYKAGSTKYIAN